MGLERLAGIGGRSLGDGERHAEDGVGAQTALRGGAVEIDQRLIEPSLIGGVATGDGCAISPFTLATACVTPLPR